MGDEALGITVTEEYVLEKTRTGEDTPYEVVTIHADGSRSVWRRDEEG